MKLLGTITIISSIFLFCWKIPPVEAQNIIAIKSLDIQPYNETLEGFKKGCNSSIIEYSFSDNNISDILQHIRARKPDLILTIGLRALNNVRDIGKVPIVYSMISNPQPLLSGKDNMTGVSMNISAYKQLSLFIDGIPGIKRIGIIYDSNQTARLFTEARDAASSLGITVISKAVQDPKEVPEAFKGMIHNIDAFWMLPDITVITPEALKYLFLSSLEKNIPVLTFSEKYVKKGAVMSVNIDEDDIGQQACEMAKEILNGKRPEDIPRRSPRKVRTSVNWNVADKMGLTINKKILQN